MTRARPSLLPILLTAILLVGCGGCTMPPPYVPSPTPTPVPVPTPTPTPAPVTDPVDEGTISDWSVFEPIQARYDSKDPLKRSDFRPMGKPYRSLDIQVGDKPTIVSWHVRRNGVVLNVHARFKSSDETADLIEGSLNVR